MTFEISNSQLTITNTPDLRGASVPGAIFYSGGSNTRPGGEIAQLSSGIEVNTGAPGQDVTLDIPAGVDQTTLEKAMDGAMVKTGDMAQDDFNTKWPDETS